ncbi:hypothetical protein D3C74_337070 [compost metagenome]
MSPVHQRVHRPVFVAGSLNGSGSLRRPVQQVISAGINGSPFAAFDRFGRHLHRNSIIISHMGGDQRLPLRHIVGVQAVARARAEAADIVKKTRELPSPLRVGRLHPLQRIFIEG